ncbi:unnamed protein product [Gongylonema pulchrum]|uniref:Alternative protein n=1 Tax=Gongylonema pulchrum TaxID=637853 RepID=A0A183DQF7_9BILA|nr:unnamed protein product [Gongylonema pulchrum]
MMSLCTQQHTLSGRPPNLEAQDTKDQAGSARTSVVPPAQLKIQVPTDALLSNESSLQAWRELDLELLSLW